MGWLSKSNREEAKARRRARKLSTTDLVWWAHNTVTEIGTCLRIADDAHLDHAKAQTEILYDLLTELRGRR